jgi:hypothetical protein
VSNTSPTKSITRGKGTAAKNIIHIHFDPHELPNHSGWFEIRLHLNNDYGRPHDKCSCYMMEAKISPIKRIALLLFFVGLVATFQHFLNAKGVCPFLDPDVHPIDPIDDNFVRLTAPINRYFIENPAVVELAQAISSLTLDFGMVLLVTVATTRRSSIQPFLALFLLMTFRFVAQLMAVIPCPPGFLWPKGKIYGYEVPTLFVDYHPANDMFFSGHTGTSLLIGLELWQLDYHRLAMFQLLIILPLISTFVVSVRVHRGIDVVAAILASIAACSIAKHIAEDLDRVIQVHRQVADKETAINSKKNK